MACIGEATPARKRLAAALPSPKLTKHTHTPPLSSSPTSTTVPVCLCLCVCGRARVHACVGVGDVFTTSVDPFLCPQYVAQTRFVVVVNALYI